MFLVFNEVGNQMMLNADEQLLLDLAVSRLDSDKAKKHRAGYLKNHDEGDVVDSWIVEALIGDIIKEIRDGECLGEINPDEIGDEFYSGDVFLKAE